MRTALGLLVGLLALPDCVDEDAVPPTAAVCLSAERVGASQMRRLTRTEYVRTVWTLFGVRIDVANLLPEDSNARGFDNQAEVQEPTGAEIGAWQQAAEAVTQEVLAAGTEPLLGCALVGGDSDPCLTEFVQTFGRRAFRRPISAEEQGRYVAFYQAQLAAGAAPERAFEMLLQGMLMAPQFLYLVEFGMEGDASALDGYALATRLSYLLWNDMPDEELFAAATSGQLASTDDIDVQARRMLADPRATDVVADFYAQWIGARHLSSVAVPEGFDSSLPDSMEASSDRFIRSWFEDDGTVADLLTSTRVFVDDKLASYYGLDIEVGSSLVAAELDPERYAGLLTRPEMVATHSIPPSRGSLILSQLLCTPLTLPATEVPDPPQGDAYATRRERFEAHAELACAAACHGIIDPLGFPFEHYDAYGRWRAQDGGIPVNASTILGDGLGEPLSGPVEDAVQLSSLLAESDAVMSCQTQHWFTYAYNRPVTEEDACTADSLETALITDGRVQDLLLALTVTDAFRYVRKLPARQEE